MPLKPRVVSLQVGRVRTLGTPGATDRLERPWKSAYIKPPVLVPLRLSRTRFEGDEQYDVDSHGGPEMAALAYCDEHYALWRDELDLAEMGPGGFGENLTISGLDEDSVAVGDVYAIGSARVQVSQPRGPCFNISKRWRRAELLDRVVATGRTGWYFRVLDEGQVTAGDPVVRLQRPLPEWTVARTLRLGLDPSPDPASCLELANCDLLSPGWREKFRRRSGTAG